LYYKSNGNGYVFYGVGVNCVIDGGKRMDDAKNCESGDDIALRIKRPVKARE
jgi:hypothetical protein